MSDLIERAADVASDSRNLDGESEVITELMDEIERLLASNDRLGEMVCEQSGKCESLL